MAEHDLGSPIRPYGVAIRQAIGGGDIEAMKRMCAEAERWLAEHGDVSSALEVLKAEIAKREAAG